MSQPLTIVWFRKDLRLGDHDALTWAAHRGLVLPVVIRDEEVDSWGAAAQWRYDAGLRVLQRQLRSLGLDLILRSGAPLDVLPALVSETGADAVAWHRAYDPAAIARDTKVKARLKSLGIAAQSFAGHVLFEPWTVATKTGGPYRVFTPFWKGVRGRDVGPVLPVPRLQGPTAWPKSENLDGWQLAKGVNRGAQVLARHCVPGEAAAQDRLDSFVATRLSRYATDRDRPAEPATSGLSEYLAWGEIAPRRIWAAGQAALRDGVAGAETFLKELVWRDFAYHLMWHSPHILTENWKPDWDAFPWTQDPGDPRFRAWCQGRTGVPFVDAAMRELYVTGRMHNRGRMIVASYLTKHLMIHWKCGLDWFADCLTDWDPASNAMGWQWAAGSGPDAAPFFRIFNPVTQLDKFDPLHAYPGRWIAEMRAQPGSDALDFFAAAPQSWDLRADAAYPEPLVDLAEGRARALAAYADRPKPAAQ